MDALSELQKTVQLLLERQKKFEERLEILEAEKEDKRLKQDMLRVMGFSIIKNQNYYHANKNVSGERFRIYLGRNIPTEAEIREKIIAWFNTHTWQKGQFLEAHPEYKKEFVAE